MGGLEGPTAPNSLSLTHVLVVHSRTLTHSLAKGVKSNFAVLSRPAWRAAFKREVSAAAEVKGVCSFRLKERET